MNENLATLINVCSSIIITDIQQIIFKHLLCAEYQGCSFLLCKAFPHPIDIMMIILTAVAWPN